MGPLVCDACHTVTFTDVPFVSITWTSWFTGAKGAVSRIKDNTESATTIKFGNLFLITYFENVCKSDLPCQVWSPNMIFKCVWDQTLQNRSNEGKPKDWRKRLRSEERERRREKSNGCNLSFYNIYFGDSFWPKKAVGRKRSIWR